MDKKKLDEIRARLEMTTPGEWKKCRLMVMCEGRALFVSCELPQSVEEDGNVDFAAHAHQDISDLLDYAVRLRELLDQIVNKTTRDHNESVMAASAWNNSECCADGNYMAPDPLPSWYGEARAILGYGDEPDHVAAGRERARERMKVGE